MKNRLLRISLAAMLLAVLAGCGNKGPLVHPQSPADAMAVPATTTTPADASMPAPAAPSEATAPAPATTTPAAPVEPAPVPPADGGG